MLKEADTVYCDARSFDWFKIGYPELGDDPLCQLERRKDRIRQLLACNTYLTTCPHRIESNHLVYRGADLIVTSRRNARYIFKAIRFS